MALGWCSAFFLFLNFTSDSLRWLSVLDKMRQLPFAYEWGIAVHNIDLFCVCVCVYVWKLAALLSEPCLLEQKDWEHHLLSLPFFFFSYLGFCVTFQEFLLKYWSFTMLP